MFLKGFRANNTRYRNLGGEFYVSTDPANPAPPAGKSVYYLYGTHAIQASNILKAGQIFPFALALETYRPIGVNAGYYSSIVKATHRKRGVKEFAPAGRSKIRS